MKSLRWLWFPLGMAACVAGCGPSVEGRQLKGAEISTLFADHTVKGHHEIGGYDFRSYYEPNGTFRSHQSNAKAPKTARWWVFEDDVCIEWDADPGPLCRTMVEQDGRYRKVLLLPKRAKTVVSFTAFIPGNPEGL